MTPKNKSANVRKSKGDAGSFKNFRDLTRRFEALREEVATVHRQWLEVHKEQPDNYLARLDELMKREAQGYSELDKVIHLSYKMMAKPRRPQ